MKSENTAPILEKLFVGAILMNGEKIGEYPNSWKILDDKLAQTVMKTVEETGDTNLVTLSVSLQKAGYQEMTPEVLADTFVEPAIKWGYNLRVSYDSLANLYLIRTGLPAIDEYRDAVRTGGMSLLQMSQAIAEKAYEFGTSDVRYVASDQWGGQYSIDEVERQRAYNASGKAPRWISTHNDIAKRIKRLSGITLIMADTGTGKTILLDTLAHNLAEVHGRTVLSLITEATVQEMRWRYVCRRANVAMDWLQEGNWNDGCEAVVKPYPSGGKVIYAEASGMPLESAIAMAMRNDADLVADLISDLSFEAYSRRSGTDSDTIKRGLMAVEGFCQKKGKLAIGSLQVGLAARRESRNGGLLDAGAAYGAAHWENKASLFVTMQNRKADEDLAMRHPLDSTREIRVPRGRFIPIARLHVSKNRLGGGSGFGQLLFLEGSRFRLDPINDPDTVEFLEREYLS